MSDTNGSGIEYPEIELGGKRYPVKFTGAAMRRLEKAGLSFRPTFIDEGKGVTIGFSMLVDVLAICISYQGTHDELADLVWPKAKRDECATALMKGWGNLWQSSGQIQIRETTANNPQADLPTQ